MESCLGYSFTVISPSPNTLSVKYLCLMPKAYSMGSTLTSFNDFFEKARSMFLHRWSFHCLLQPIVSANDL